MKRHFHKKDILYGWQTYKKMFNAINHWGNSN